jgi:hypothetical protein
MSTKCDHCRQPTESTLYWPFHNSNIAYSSYICVPCLESCPVPPQRFGEEEEEKVKILQAEVTSVPKPKRIRKSRAKQPSVKKSEEDMEVDTVPLQKENIDPRTLPVNTFIETHVGQQRAPTVTFGGSELHPVDCAGSVPGPDHDSSQGDHGAQDPAKRKRKRTIKAGRDAGKLRAELDAAKCAVANGELGSPGKNRFVPPTQSKGPRLPQFSAPPPGSTTVICYSNDPVLRQPYRALEMGLHTTDYILMASEYGLKQDPGVLSTSTTHIIYGPVDFSSEDGCVTFQNPDVEDGNAKRETGEGGPKAAGKLLTGLLDYVKKLKSIMPLVKVIVSVPSLNTECFGLDELAKDPAKLFQFIKTLSELVISHYLDGVQIDFSANISHEGIQLIVSQLQGQGSMVGKELHVVMPRPTTANQESTRLLSLVAHHVVTTPIESEEDLRYYVSATTDNPQLHKKLHPMISTLKLGLSSAGIPLDVKSYLELYAKHVTKGLEIKVTGKAAHATIKDEDGGGGDLTYSMMSEKTMKSIGDTMVTMGLQGYLYGPVGCDCHSAHKRSIIWNASKYLPTTTLPTLR